LVGIDAAVAAAVGCTLNWDKWGSLMQCFAELEIYWWGHAIGRIEGFIYILLRVSAHNIVDRWI
jgi:hypothetical protein